jgi:hypothetical protein
MVPEMNEQSNTVPMNILTAIRIYFSPMSYPDDAVRRAITAVNAWEAVNPGRSLMEAVKNA